MFENPQTFCLLFYTKQREDAHRFELQLKVKIEVKETKPKNEDLKLSNY